MSEATFRTIVRDAFTNTLRKSEDPKEYPAILADELRALFRANGYAVHRTERCVSVHPMGQGLGREMTPAERIMLGVKEAGAPEGAPAEGGSGSGEGEPTEDRTLASSKKGSES